MNANLQPDLLQQIIARSQAQHRLYSVHWELTYRCNERCTHCYLNILPAKRRAPGELTYDECCAIIDQAAEEGALEITFSGGEVFVRRDFLSIAEHARSRRFAIRIFTNGTMITEPMADRVAALHPLRVELSVYGKDAETHDLITRIPGSFNLTMRAFRLLRERNVRLRCKTPLMRENVRQFHQLRALAESLGAEWKYDITITARDGGDRAPLRHRLTDEDLLWLMRETMDVEMWKRRLNQPLTPEHRFCGIGLSSITIDPYGEVFPCAQTRVSAGNLRKRSLREIWRHSPIWERVSQLTLNNLPACSCCPVRQLCTRCHGQAWLEDGDIRGPSSDACREAYLRRQVLREKGVM